MSIVIRVRWFLKGWVLVALLFCSCAGNRAAQPDLSGASGGVSRKKGPLPDNQKTLSTLTVQIHGFRNDKGFARAALFRDEDGFPSEKEKAFRLVEAPIRNGEATLVFREIPAGVCAVAIMHDETVNGALDVSAIGIPREGFCVSNDTVGVLGPPSFEQARFDLNQSDQRIELKMRYFLPLEP